jgi:hypothetical protein
MQSSRGAGVELAAAPLHLTHEGPVITRAGGPRVCAMPLSIHVKDLSLTYVQQPTGVMAQLRKLPPTRKTILNHIDAHAKPGRIIALMGGSGCGKTSLLNVMAARQYGGEVTGAIEYSHRDPSTGRKEVITDPAAIKALTGYGKRRPEPALVPAFTAHISCFAPSFAK